MLRSSMSLSTWSWVGPTNCAPCSMILPPPMSWLSVRPPTRSRASSTITDLPAAAIWRAAMSPEIPAPTIRTSALVRVVAAGTFADLRRCFLLLLRCRRAASAGDAARPPSTAPAAPVLMTVRRVYFEPLMPAAGRYRFGPNGATLLVEARPPPRPLAIARPALGLEPPLARGARRPGGPAGAGHVERRLEP